MYYCWFDSEYTDNDYDKAELLEVALLVTDPELRPVPYEGDGIPTDLLTGEGFTACLVPPPRSRISDFVLENQAELLDRCERVGRPLAEVDRYLAAFLDQTVPWAEDKKSRPVMAGNTIHADYFLARKYLPELVSRLNFRVLDVTALKLEWLYHYGKPRFNKHDPDLVRSHFPGRSLVEGEKHDALYDVQASVAELAYYRSHVGLVTVAKETSMKKFIIERDIPKAGSMDREELKQAAAKSNSVLQKLGTDIQWVQSFVAADKIFCVYLASDEAIIRKHAELAGFPATKVTEVKKVIDPTTAAD